MNGNTSHKIKPQNLAEAIVWYYIIGTLVLYFAGAQFLTGPAIAWFFFLYLLKRLWHQTDDTPPAERIRIPVGVWVWIGSMMVIGFALIMGHFDQGYDLTKTIKSFINFFLRTWALLALFPLAGCLKIRPQIIYRAICILCLQCFVLVLICYAAHFGGIELPKYTSSILASIGGNDPRYYGVSLSMVQEGSFRLLLFAPWAPALAFAGNIFFCLASQDPSRVWRWIGMISSALMVWGSASRLGLLCLIILPIARSVLVNISRPSVQIGTGIASLLGGVFGYQLIVWLKDFKDFFDGQRESSSRIRAVLRRMAFYEWQHDAPIWGHGLKSPRGPEVTNFMPLGSHHTWFGLLYVHGLVGFIGLAVPMAFSLCDLLIKAQKSKLAQTGLSVMVILLLFSMGENLETLAYLYWPGLVVVGMAFGVQEATEPQPHLIPAPVSSVTVH